MDKIIKLVASAIMVSLGMSGCMTGDLPRKAEFPDNAFSEIPSDYLSLCDEQGTVVSISYETKDYGGNGEKFEKRALVYLPYGYDGSDESKKYDVMYYMHGGGGTEDELFGGVLSDNESKRIIDHMIKNGDLKPCIICTPSYNNPYNGDASYCCKNFWQELVNDVIPAVESEYNTFCSKTTKSGIKASRLHRGFGGFSMGAACTWWVFENALNYVGYDLPVAGDSWALGQGAGGYNPDGAAEYLAEAVKGFGYDWEDFYIYCGVGTNDNMAGPNMQPMVASMQKEDFEDVFKWADNFKDGNCYFVLRNGGWHDQNTVRSLIYNGLPKFFG